MSTGQALPRRVVVILGATGRLGPAVVRAFRDWETRGLSRRTPAAGEERPDVFTQALRSDEGALTRLVDGADSVVDLVGFSEADADGLLRSIAGAERPPRHLVFASSIAERGSRRFGEAEEVASAPEDAWGKGKLAARRRYESEFPGIVHSLILPRLVAPIDHARREQPYLDTAAGGRVLVAGDGRARQVIASVDGVAGVIRALCDEPARAEPGPLNVGPSESVTVEEAVRALLQGAGIQAEIARHPDPRWRGPHGSGPEPLDTSRLRRLLPEIGWPDVLDAYRSLGRWMAANPREPVRPIPLVKGPDKRYLGRRVVDVHGRRSRPVLEHESPQLARLASWLSPGFYLDLGRPCNSACVYCAVPPHLDTAGFAPLDSLRDQIAAGAGAGCDRAILIGGEPTIHPRLTDVFDLLGAAGFGARHVIMTNGLRLSDPSFLDALTKRGLRTVHLSIDTADEKVYERISRTAGTFARQWRALENVLSRPELNLYVYCAATAYNAEGIPELLRTVAARAASVGVDPPPLVVAFVKPLGDALTHIDHLMIPATVRSRLAHEAVAAGRAVGVPVGLRNLQACLAPDLLAHLVDYYVDDHSVDVRTGQREQDAHEAEYQRHVQACETCAHRPLCGGAYTAELRRGGDAAFSALGTSGLAASALA